MRWGHMDMIRDTVPGMSVDRAYQELLKKRKGQPVIVAVIDSGIDLDHEDLKDVLWVNPGEKAGDGIDNENNGYNDTNNDNQTTHQPTDPPTNQTTDQQNNRPTDQPNSRTK